MKASHSCLQDLPIITEVDLLVIGGTSAGVAFALSAERAGHSVYLVSQRPYLGEDICAAYRFWPNQQPLGHLATTIFGNLEAPPTPMHVKLTLEQRLIKADIPFLFNCFSAGVLRSPEGRICGVAIANRSGHQAIKARLVVDATLDGSVLKQAGHSDVHRLQGKQSVSFVTLCDGEGETSSTPVKAETLKGYNAPQYTITARRYTVEADFGDGGPRQAAKALSTIKEMCWVPHEYRYQTVITPELPATTTAPQWSNIHVAEGLVALTEAVKLNGGSEAVFSNPVTAMLYADLLGADAGKHLPAASGETLIVYCHGAQSLPEGEIRTLKDALRPGAQGKGSVLFDASKLPILDSFDVVIVGGGTGGAPAAIAAARAGADTLTVEVTSGLGGVGTLGQIAKYWYGNRVGFTSEIDAGVNELETEEKYRNCPNSWSIAAKAAWYHKAGFEAGSTYWFNTLCVGVLLSEENKVSGILVAGPYGYGLVKTKAVVDSTGCSDIPAAAGAPTVVIGKEHVAVQGTGLAGVMPGRDYNNSDHNFSDDTDVVDTTAFFVSSKLKFKNDFDCGELVDSRERRQIVGDYSLTPVDILFQRRFPDTLCVATSNFDSHGFTVDPTFMIIPPNKHEALWADVPLRCLLPRGLEGVLVTGLGVSAHRDALPVIRMQADVQNQGYAAGVIAAKSAQTGTAIRKLDIKEIQQHLIEVGSLPNRVLTDADNFPVADEVLAQAVENEWDSLPGVSLILHEAQRSRSLLLQAYQKLEGQRNKQSLRYAQLLALLGNNAGQQELISEISSRPWDQGWQFRGMHQFGMNMSELDSLIVCLGLSGDASAWDCILEKIKTLPAETEFSHFRALTMACEALYAKHPNSEASTAFNELLQREDFRGHSHTSIQSAQAALTEDSEENDVRNKALRELHLARALYNCGDYDNLGASILNEYANDFRGHFARHARAVLAGN